MSDRLLQRIRDHATALDREAPPIRFDDIRGWGHVDGNRGFRPSLAAAAAAALLVVGGLVAIKAVRESDPEPSAEPAPSEPAQPEPAHLGVCESALDAYAAMSGTAEGGPTGLTGPHEVVPIDVVGEPGAQHVMIVGEDWVFTCLVTPRIGGIATDIVRDGGSMAPSYPDVTAEPGQVIVVEQGDSSSDGQVGPATITIVGRAAPDVETVTLVMASGTTIPGSLSSGWFIIDGDVGEGVALTNNQIAWTLVNGDERSSPIRLLDAQRFSSSCAWLFGPSCGSEPQESQASPGRPISILGDALTIGARDDGDLASRLEAVGFDPIMIAAQPSADVAWGIEQAELGDILPETVIVQLGPTAASDASAFAADAERMVDVLEARSVQSIVWIVPLAADSPETASILRSVEGIDVVADWPAIVQGNPDRLSGDDGLPTAAGFTVAALFIADAAATVPATPG